MRTRSSLTFLIYGSFRGMRSPDWNHFILISSKIWFEGVKENTYNSGNTVYSCNITLGRKEPRSNITPKWVLTREKISTPLVLAILGSTQMLLLSAVNLKQAVASTCKHDKKIKFSSTSNYETSFATNWKEHFTCQSIMPLVSPSSPNS